MQISGSHFPLTMNLPFCEVTKLDGDPPSLPVKVLVGLAADTTQQARRNCQRQMGSMEGNRKARQMSGAKLNLEIAHPARPRVHTVHLCQGWFDTMIDCGNSWAVHGGLFDKNLDDARLTRNFWEETSKSLTNYCWYTISKELQDIPWSLDMRKKQRPKRLTISSILCWIPLNKFVDRPNQKSGLCIRIYIQ